MSNNFKTLILFKLKNALSFQLLLLSTKIEVLMVLYNVKIVRTALVMAAKFE